MTVSLEIARNAQTDDKDRSDEAGHKTEGIGKFRIVCNMRDSVRHKEEECISESHDESGGNEGINAAF